MGLFRLMLALAVVLHHTDPSNSPYWVGPDLAVEIFFMVSGFYMALVLDRKYAGLDNYRLFLSNRLLRLVPVYWLVLLMTIGLGVLAWVVQGRPIGALAAFQEYHGALTPGTLVSLIVPNLVLFGQDWLAFFGIDLASGRLFFDPLATAAEPLTREFMFIRQAWTLGVELTFYVIAPFLVLLSTRVLVVLLALSLLLRAWLAWGLGLTFEPWGTQFFPAELSFFLAGMLGYRAYRAGYVVGDGNRAMQWAVVALLVGGGMALRHLPGGEATVVAYVGLVVIGLPSLFHATRSNAADRWIGELSYPVYICHHLPIKVMLEAGDRLGWHDVKLPVVILTLILSALLVKLVVDPIEGWRQRRAARAHRHPGMQPAAQTLNQPRPSIAG